MLGITWSISVYWAFGTIQISSEHLQVFPSCHVCVVNHYFKHKYQNELKTDPLVGVKWFSHQSHTKWGYINN
jgi:hypothetical protein